MIEYQLLDSGFRQRLEKWGSVIVIRPDPTATWSAVLPKEEWQKANVIYSGSQGKIGQGQWEFKSGFQELKEQGLQIKCQLNKQFPLLTFQLKFMPSKHMGLFPEHEPQWLKMQNLILESQASLASDFVATPFRVLNLFAFTGAASLACAQAGAQVTHVDSSYEAIGLARESQHLSGLDQAPIRWIKEDVLKFVAREARRQSLYDAIILDPPAFGHGAKGESWSTTRDLPRLMEILTQLLSPRAKFLLLNTYALGPNQDNFRRQLHQFNQQLKSHFPNSPQSGTLSLTPTTPHSPQLTTGDFTWWIN